MDVGSFNAPMTAASLVQSLVEFAHDCEIEYAETGDLPADALVVLMTAVRDCRAGLDVLGKKIEQDLIHTAGKKRFTVDGVGEVEIKGNTKRTAWQWDDLLSAIISRVMDEPTTLYDEDGTLLPYVQIGYNLGAKLRECVGMNYGKVTGLRELGIDPSEYCTETFDGWSVKLPKREASL